MFQEILSEHTKFKHVALLLILLLVVFQEEILICINKNTKKNNSILGIWSRMNIHF